MGQLLENDSLTEFLTDRGVFEAGTPLRFEPLAGGVSSDIWLASGPDRSVVIKTPLPTLKVADDWQAPVTRSASEVGWLRVVGELLPGICPRVLAYDDERNLLALSYLDPIGHVLWKDELLEGRVVRGTAALVGDRIGAVHRLTSRRADLPEEFATDDLFRALRMEPYLGRLGDRHPDLREQLETLVDTTMAHRFALVHGDVSPKNILVGTTGPVFLDAETAWWGDPAFDVAFCLNHLLLKCLLPTAPVDQLLEAVHALAEAHARHVTWEYGSELQARVVRLLPALMLARVDGRSPVEYLTPDAQNLVRAFARLRILHPRDELAELVGEWRTALS